MIRERKKPDRRSSVRDPGVERRQQIVNQLMKTMPFEGCELVKICEMANGIISYIETGQIPLSATDRARMH